MNEAKAFGARFGDTAIPKETRFCHWLFSKNTGRSAGGTGSETVGLSCSVRLICRQFAAFVAFESCAALQALFGVLIRFGAGKQLLGVRI